MPSTLGLDFDLTQLSFGIFGFLIVLMMVLRPEGLLPERRRKLELVEGVGRRRGQRCTRCAHERVRGRQRRADGKRRARSWRPADVTKAFGGLVAVSEVDFSIPRRSIVSIIGPNGAGKTTFFNMLTGLYKPTTGTIAFDGKRHHAAGGRTRSWPWAVARTFQNIRLFATMSALENVMVGQHARMQAGLLGSIFRPPWVSQGGARGAPTRRASCSSTWACAAASIDELAINLSYGDQRRVEIARALASDPTAAAARRAHGRDEPAGVGAARRASCARCATSGA